MKNLRRPCGGRLVRSSRLLLLAALDRLAAQPEGREFIVGEPRELGGDRLLRHHWALAGAHGVAVPASQSSQARIEAASPPLPRHRLGLRGDEDLQQLRRVAALVRLCLGARGV
jgi:hypothetical protein